MAFSPSLFDYGSNEFASRVPQNLGFAGFRLHYKTNFGPDMVVLHFHLDCADAMGANMVNTVAEHLAPHVEAATNETVADPSGPQTGPDPLHKGCSG